FATIATLFGAIGIIIIMQGVIIDEKKSGTAAWIASKPTSRAAFVLSTLVANVVASLVVIVLIQGGIAYLQFALRGNAPPLGPFLWGLALMSLHLLFYLTLTLMLGTLFNERGAVIAIPLVVLFSAQFVMGLSPSLTMYTPWPLLFPTAIGDPLPIQAMTGQTLTTVTPIVATIVWIVVFVGVAIWRFEREEF
ncbi:MAG: ABC transporter permease subunit, partial [Anaerolineae bacterium]|nr:ABC transporter permease subunit [Anaerolineae bacterium]